DAGGTVDYRYAGPLTAAQAAALTCDGTSGTLINTASVTNGSVSASSTKTLSAAGIYEFWAIYSGDSNNNGSTSTCRSETVIVGKNSPATSTQVKDTHNNADTADDTNVVDGSTVSIGTGVYDTSTLSTPTSDAGGTVDYRYAGPLTAAQAAALTCDGTSGTLINTASVTNGSVAASSTKTLSAAGIYEFWAIYSGDSNNNGSTSTCRSETVIVGKNSPATSTQVKDTHNTADTADDTNVVDGSTVS